MQQTSALYKQIMAEKNHWFETRLVVGYDGDLITENGDRIMVGGVSINIGVDDEGGYDERVLWEMSITQALFSGSTPTVGGCVSGEIDIKMLKPSATYKQRAELLPFVRITDGTRHSEWISKGVFYIDTRETTHNTDKLTLLTIHGYDSMLKAERDYPVPIEQQINWSSYALGSADSVSYAASRTFMLDSDTISKLTSLAGETLIYSATVEGMAAQEADAASEHDIGDVTFFDSTDTELLSVSVGGEIDVDGVLTATKITVYGSVKGAKVYDYSFANASDTVSALQMVETIIQTLNNDINGSIGENDIRRLHLSAEDAYKLRHPNPEDRPVLGSEDDVDNGYEFSYIASTYSCREVLSMIAAAYCGNWFIDDSNYLRLALLNEYPTETYRLIDEAGYQLVVGGEHISVQ